MIRAKGYGTNLAAVVLFGLSALFSFSSGMAETKEDGMIADMTIYLDKPVLGNGGTVVVLPTKVPLDRWQEGGGGANPALKDDRLDARFPLNAGDRRLGVTVTEQISVVRFEYPETGTFRFRFSPVLGSDYPMEKLGTKNIGVGSGSYPHPETGETVKLDRIMTIHVLGQAYSEEKSRVDEAQARISDFLHAGSCREFQKAIVCTMREP